MKSLKLGLLGLCALAGFACNSASSTSGSEVTITGTTDQIAASVSSRALTRADTGLDPDSVQLKIYKIAVSESADCSDLIEVFSDDAADYSDFSGNPTLGNGTIPDGTYNCVAIEMSDQVVFTPATSSDSLNCVAGEENTIDVCRPDNNGTTLLIDGTESDCTDGDDRVALYLSTDSITLPKEPGAEGDNEGNNFAPPADGELANGFFLDGAFEVSGTSAGTFVVDFTGRVGEEDGECGMQPPNWGFE